MEATADVEMAEKPSVRMVEKRDGTKQPFDKAKVLKRAELHAEDLDRTYVTLDDVVEKVVAGVYDGKSIPTPTSIYMLTYRCQNKRD
jgi:transcriptional regulator NrdR family protein